MLFGIFYLNHAMLFGEIVKIDSGRLHSILIHYQSIRGSGKSKVECIVFDRNNGLIGIGLAHIINGSAEVMAGLSEESVGKVANVSCSEK